MDEETFERFCKQAEDYATKTIQAMADRAERSEKKYPWPCMILLDGDTYRLMCSGSNIPLRACSLCSEMPELMTGWNQVDEETGDDIVPNRTINLCRSCFETRVQIIVDFARPFGED